MRTRYLVSGLVAAAFLSTTAFAQTTTPSTPPPPAAKVDATAPKLASPHWRSSKMIGLVVYNEQKLTSPPTPVNPGRGLIIKYTHMLAF